MNIAGQYGIRGGGASDLAASIEGAVREGRLAVGASLPTVRALARSLRLSPTTVAAAYRVLRTRGLIQARGRRGTRVSHRPPLAMPLGAPVPKHLRNLADGNPDPA
ncbi:MAG: GntR family transcriptional regulator, partial [Candidatus Binatia bacterium]